MGGDVTGTDGRLPGKVALVTGATSGIGRTTAVALAAEGATVIATGRNAERGEQTVQAIRQVDGHAEFIAQDVTLTDGWQTLMADIAQRHGRLDIAVNSAGAFFTKPLEDTSLEAFRALWQVNVESCFLGTKHAMELMARSGGGSIINITSLAGRIGLEDCSAYCASKAAVIALSRVAAVEAARAGTGVRVNALAPGVIWTEMIYNAYGDTPEARAFCIDGNALNLLGEPEDVAHGVVYLASDAARHVTATTLVIDGGRGAD